jgi:hypothetical protein
VKRRDAEVGQIPAGLPGKKSPLPIVVTPERRRFIAGGDQELFVRFANIFIVAFAGAFTLGSTAAYADPEALSPAAKLSAALAGSLDSDIGEAGALDHSVDYSSVMRRPARSDEYRQRVALEMQLAAR